MIEQVWGQAIATKSVYRAKGRLWNATRQVHQPFAVEAVPMLDENGRILEWFGTISETD